LANYFRNQLKGKRVHTPAIRGILGAMQTMAGPGARPRLKPAVSVYSKLHYAERVKPGFDAIWETAKETSPQSARVAMSQDYVRTCWAKESDEFKAEVERVRDEMHQTALAEWKASRQVPEGSAEDYHKYVASTNIVQKELIK
jgi:hypothetical protein